MLFDLLRRENVDLSGVHGDCGKMIYDRDGQDVHAGGSGCGCSASVLCSHIFDEMRHFFSVYKVLEDKETVVSEPQGAEEAREVIQKCLNAYIDKFCR